MTLYGIGDRKKRADVAGHLRLDEIFRRRVLDRRS
jgi:hypothetical protein